MRVLIACEFSGIVRDAFREKGHNAWSCDLLATESDPKYHIQDDVLKHLNEGWDMIIAHPPCTYLCNSGVRWLYEKKDRWVKMEKAIEFFKRFLYADCPYIAVENPIMHHFALDKIRHKYQQIIQPWQFGHPETKATCLWLKNLPCLKATDIVEDREHKIHKMPPSVNRGKERSRTFKGIAKAMAEQWSFENVEVK